MSKSVIITGASGGIGSAMVIRFAEAGWNVLLHYHNSTAAARLLKDSLVNRGLSVMTYQADIRSGVQVEGMVDAAYNRFGHIDALINNAGIAQQKVFGDISEGDWDAMIDTHLKGAFLCTRAVLPHFIRQKAGKIINISSMWGVTGGSCEVHYSAAKAGLIGMTKALAKELGPSGINVNCIAPGLIETAMNNNIPVDSLAEFVDSIPLGRMGSPAEVADLAYFLCSEQADYITGQIVGQDGGYAI